MKITETITKRKPLVLVVPEDVKGIGWEALRKAISSMQVLSDQAVKASNERIKKSGCGIVDHNTLVSII